MSLKDQSWPDSLWRATAVDFPDQPALTENVDCEVAVIGAGFTGLSTAIHLAEQGQEVVVVDKVQPGWGCSGRNGGQVNPNWKVLPENIKKYYSNEVFERVLKAVNGTCDFLFDLVDKYKIDCDAIRPGYVLAIVGRKDYEFASQWSEQWSKVGSEVYMMSRQEASDLLGTDVYDVGMMDSRGGSVQPLSYARGLAKVAINLGVKIHGDTLAEKITRQGNGWCVGTPHGEIRCKKVVIGTNGYTDQLWPGLAKTIVPVASLISATAPLSDELASQILPKRNAVSDAAGMPVYYRIDSYNRMVFGGRANLLGRIGTMDTRKLRAQAIKIYPALENVEWEYDWGGYVAMTSHHRPMLLKLDDGVFAGLGYNGRGVAMATYMGDQLCRAINGEATEIPIDSPRPLPLHAGYPLGIAARTVAGLLKDKVTQRLPAE